MRLGVPKPSWDGRVASAMTGPSLSTVENPPRSGEAYLPSAEPLQLVAAWFPVDLPVGGSTNES